MSTLRKTIGVRHNTLKSELFVMQSVESTTGTNTIHYILQYIAVLVFIRLMLRVASLIVLSSPLTSLVVIWCGMPRMKIIVVRSF